jgi:hypothetical protein
MKLSRIQVLAFGVAALSVVPASACASNSSSGGGGGEPAAGSTAGAETGGGEAPVVTYVDARFHYRIDAPGQMTSSADGTASVVGPSERLAIAVVLGSRASDPASLAKEDVSALPGSRTSFHLVSGPAAMTLNSKKVTKFVYSYNAGSSPVTGKPLDLVGVRYYIPKDSSTVAVLDYAIVTGQYDPEGADDLARTFQWQ